jgi:hypothetical protein
LLGPVDQWHQPLGTGHVGMPLTRQLDPLHRPIVIPTAESRLRRVSFRPKRSGVEKSRHEWQARTLRGRFRRQGTLPKSRMSPVTLHPNAPQRKRATTLASLRLHSLQYAPDILIETGDVMRRPCTISDGTLALAKYSPTWPGAP